MRDDVIEYFKAAVTRPFNLAEMAVDMWYPGRGKPGYQPQSLMAQIQACTVQLVADGLAVEVPGKEGEVLYYWKAYNDASLKKIAAQENDKFLRNASFFDRGSDGRPFTQAKNAPIIIH